MVNGLLTNPVKLRGSKSHIFFFLQIIYVVCERLLELAKKGQALSQIRKTPSGVTLDRKLSENGDVPQENGLTRVTSQISLEAPKTSQNKRLERKQSVCMEDLPNDKLLKLDHQESCSSAKSDPDTNSSTDLLSQKSDEVDPVSSELGNLSTNDVAEALGSTYIEESVYEQADRYQVKNYQWLSNPSSLKIYTKL